MKNRIIFAALKTAHEFAESVTCALGWGLALTATTSTVKRPAKPVEWAQVDFRGRARGVA